MDHLLEAARAAKEVAIVAALMLIATGGDPHEAIRRLDDLPGPEGDELDAAKIAQQAIRESITVLETGALPC